MVVLQPEPHSLEGPTLVTPLARLFSQGEGSQHQGSVPSQSLCPILLTMVLVPRLKDP